MISNDDSVLKDQIAKQWQASAERAAQSQAGTQKAPYIDLTKSAIELAALKLVPMEQAKAGKLVVFEHKHKVLAVGAYDPNLPEAKKVLDGLTKEGYTIKLFLVSQVSLDYAWGHYEFVIKDASQIGTRVDIKPEKVLALQKELTTLAKVNDEMQKVMSGDISVASIIEVALAGAMTNRASDIHFESSEQGTRLRYRIDGVLHDVVMAIPGEVYELVVSRIKLLSNLRLNIKTISQDGRFTIGLGEVEIEMRVSIIPSEFGETIVMRILDPRSIQITMADLGFRPDDFEIVERGLKAPNGMILNTGPTGSGKTTTLYAFLRNLASPELKIITIEDPIEYHLGGIEQTQVDPASGYTFVNGLQAMMRQDPDVILVGEIRDKDTAEIAIQAALTGHLVFSTLHTNSASGVIPRFLDLGAPATSIGPALALIIAQRLLRRLCESCKVPAKVSGEMQTTIKKFIDALPERVDKKTLANVTLFEAKKTDGKIVGCEKCNNNGYRGRLGIYELLEVGDDMEELIASHAGEATIHKFAIKKGMVTLQQDGLIKALMGKTSFEEVESVTGPLVELTGGAA